MKASIDYDAACLLLAAIVKQARKDANRDPLAVAFLQSVGARLVVPTKTNGTVDKEQERTI